MNFGMVVTLLQQVITYAPGVISTAEQLYTLGEKFAATLKGEEPTPEEIAALRANIDADVTIALAPLPPAQPGDPDYIPPDEQN
jgi:hypothetical protein